jgi:hypothetical protein
VAARTHQSLIWDRQHQVLRLRSALREFFPAELIAFEDLAAADALGMLGRAPDPTRAARVSRAVIATALRHARRREVEVEAAATQSVLRAEQLRQPAVIEGAYAAVATSQVRIITVLNAQIAEPGENAAREYPVHRGRGGGTRPIESVRPRHSVLYRHLVGGQEERARGVEHRCAHLLRRRVREPELLQGPASARVGHPAHVPRRTLRAVTLNI